MQEVPATTRRKHTSPVGREARQARAAAKAVEQKGGVPVGILLTIFGGALFLAYSFNAGGVQTAIDGMLHGAGEQAHTHDAAVGTGFVTALPYIGAAIVLAVLYVFLRGMGVGKRKPKKRVPGESLTVHEFAELAQANGVGAKVAREAYRMLLPEYAETMRSALTTEWSRSPEVVTGMLKELVKRSEGVLRGQVDASELETPMELMQAAERCVEQAALERRAALRERTVQQETARVVVPVPAGRNGV